VQIFFFFFLFVYAQGAQAGLLSDFWKFIAGTEEIKAADNSYAAVSLPLLGSQGSGRDAGVGGSIEATPPPLPTVQESALVASRNPAGTLPSESLDQILIYTVAEGDTPGAIAERFGISLNTLLWANNIKNPRLIKVGDDLIILPVSGVQYEVKKGDTLESIAKKFKGDVFEIAGFNGLAIGQGLEIGMQVIIPDGEITLPPFSSSKVVPSRFANLKSEASGYYIRPITGGRKSRGIHGYNGIDLAAPRGSAVLASAAGTVIISRSSGWNGGYGKYVVITHANGTQTLYGHLNQVLVESGQRVSQGNAIGLVGSTGNSTGPHVHFEIRGAKNPF